MLNVFILYCTAPLFLVFSCVKKIVSFKACVCLHNGMPQSQQALIKLCSKDLCSTAGLVWDSWLGHWGAEPWQWFICQCTILTAKSGREQVRNKRAEGRYLGLKLFWNFLIKKSITKQNNNNNKKHCVVSKAMYTGLQQGTKSFIFKAVITNKNRSAIFFPTWKS